MATQERKLIENSDRGVTLNKSLAWTILVALVTLVWFGGTTITRLQASAETLLRSVETQQHQMLEDRKAAMTLEARIRAVEVAQASQASDLRAITIGINDIKAQLERISVVRN